MVQKGKLFPDDYPQIMKNIHPWWQGCNIVVFYVVLLFSYFAKLNLESISITVPKELNVKGT